MNWGVRITIVYVGFVALIVSLVVISSSNRSQLVSPDYYARELQYQDRIDAISNEKSLATSITHELLPGQVVLRYPVQLMESDFAGEVIFFRPSDAADDHTFKLHFDGNGRQAIDRSILRKGVYELQISWTNGRKNYFKKEVITI